MKKMLMKSIVLTGVLFFGIVTAHAGEIAIDGKITLDEEKLREVVKQVIKENPKLIMDTINEYVNEQKKKSEEQQFEASFQSRIKDIPVDDSSPARGKKDAGITLIEYTDFQCPYCEKASKTVDELLKKYPDQVKVVFKNNPLDFHKEAMSAAKAALAAHKQGKFWEYHDLLFANASKLNEEMFVKFAQDLKLDMDKFNKDRISEAISDQIELEKMDAAERKLTGTPVFIANGVVIRGAKTLDYFVKVVDRLLSEKSAPPANADPAPKAEPPAKAEPPVKAQPPANSKKKE
ncbi:MAG: hypothetical protein BWK80_45165 [Desulfobacteraceae bacterium IS3]|nr:MAG: hypothetical protein BWK80_45165 [Desulfobacteraceae bacterium IS3]